MQSLTCKHHGHMLTVMTRLLELGEFKFGKDSEEYRFYRREVIKVIRATQQACMEDFKALGLVVECPCEADGSMRRSDCARCGGCGYTPLKDGVLHAVKP